MKRVIAIRFKEAGKGPFTIVDKSKARPLANHGTGRGSGRDPWTDLWTEGNQTSITERGRILRGGIDCYRWGRASDKILEDMRFPDETEG